MPIAPFRTLSSAWFLVGATLAQCDLEWRGGGAHTGPDGFTACTTTWDPDGAGPLPVHVVLGGGFRAAGTVVTGYVAAFDPSTSQWLGFGNSLAEFTTGVVLALAVTGQGQLVAGGMLRIGTSTVSEGIAIWNGTSWSPMRGASGLFPLRVEALLTASNGDLFACTSWMDVGNVQRTGVLRWDGTSWTVVGGGPFLDAGGNGAVLAICEMPNGDLVVSGRFESAAGVPVSSVARWNGSSWSAVGSGLATFSRTVNSLAVMPNGELLAGGDFQSALGSVADGVATFDGTNWTQLGGGLASPIGVVVKTVEVLASGDVVAGGAFIRSNGLPTFAAARWDGTSWAQMGTGIDVALGQACYDAVQLPDGRVLMVGSFLSAGGVPTQYSALWNGAAWSAMPAGGGNAGLNGSDVVAIVTEPNGDVVVGGSFTAAGGVPMLRIARWDGTNFSPLGSGANNAVQALARMPNGDIVASGAFTQIGGVAAAGIARWNGTAWSAMGNTASGAIYVSRAGELYASTSSITGPVRWDGTNWVTVGTGWPAAGVVAFGETPTGELLASSTLSPNRCFLSRLSGGTWVPYGAPISAVVYAIASSDTDVFVAGGFHAGNGGPAEFVARYSNGTWVPVGAGLGGLVTELAFAPDGDLLAAGSFTSSGSGTPMRRIARFDGAWQPLGDGFDYAVHTLATTRDAIFAGGWFWNAGPGPAFHLARIRSTCPASATPYGTGCTGMGAPMVLAATQLPYLGATYESASTGFGPNTFGVWEIGTAQIALPVSSILPEGGAGCVQWSLLDVVADLVFPSGGVASGSIFVPASPALLGGVVYNEMALVEVDPGTGAIVRIATSNGLAMTVGAF